MSRFDHQTLENLKRLCRIDCDREEGEEILDSLRSVLQYMEQLAELNTEEVKTCRFVLRGMQGGPMRDDIPKDLLDRETFLAGAPDQIGGMIRVPPVLKTDVSP